jgi:hypothetical protein
LKEPLPSSGTDRAKANIMNWNRVFAAAFALGVFTTGTALAADPLLPDAAKAAKEAERHARIAKYDANGDGALDAAERTAMQAELNAARLAEQTAKFTAMDEDGTGDLSLHEFATGAPDNASMERIQATFARMDADHDGFVSLDEFTTRPVPPSAGPKPPADGKARRGPGGGKSRPSVASVW